MTHGHKQFYQILDLQCNSLAMAKALFQIPGTLIFQTDGFFYKNGYFFSILLEYRRCYICCVSFKWIFEFVYWQLLNLHSGKTVRIRSFFWSVFSCILTEQLKIRTRKNSAFGHFYAVLFKWSQVLILPRLHQWRIIDVSVAEDTINFFFVGYWYGGATCMGKKFPGIN